MIFLLLKFGCHRLEFREKISVLFELKGRSCGKKKKKTVFSSVRFHRRVDLLEWSLVHEVYLTFKSFFHLCWKICATKARLRFGEPSTISLAVKYLLHPILSACSRTCLALSNGCLGAKFDGFLCSGARTFNRLV